MLENQYSTEPHSLPHHTKLLFNGEHIGTAHFVMRVVHKAVGKQTVSIVPKYHVKAPEGFTGPYVEKDCSSIAEAQRHALGQHQIGTMKWTA